MRKQLLAAACLVLLGGCESWKTSARINPQTVAVYPGAQGKKASGYAGQLCPLTNGLYDTNAGAINLDCFRFPESAREGALGPYAYDLAAGMGGPAEAARNRLSAVLVKHADDVCVVEKGRLVATEASANFVLSFLTTAFAGTSTIVGGETAKSILSGIATLTSSTQDNVNATFYRNQLTQAINKAIDGERGRMMTEIIASRSKSIESFNVDDMVRLVNAYHHACSFERGLQVLLDAALDSSGADAVLESRARNHTINELKQHVAFLNQQIDNAKDATAKAELVKKRDEALSQIHGLEIAAATKRTTNPNAPDALGEAADPQEPEQAPTEGE